MYIGLIWHEVPCEYVNFGIIIWDILFICTMGNLILFPFNMCNDASTMTEPHKNVCDDESPLKLQSHSTFLKVA